MRVPKPLLLLFAITSPFLFGCGDSAPSKTSLPSVKFYAIEAVTAFPAKLDLQDGHVIGRVCGAPLNPSDPTLPLEPGPDDANGFEVTANFVASSLGDAPCAGDQALAVNEGELIDLKPVVTGEGGTITPANFAFALRQVGLPAEQTVANVATPLPATAVRYAKTGGRCDPVNEGTWQDVALIIDNSGSMKGNVDKPTRKEDAEGFYTPTVTTLTSIASDWSSLRFNAARSFTDQLNPKDRVVGYVFDENGPKVASSDSFICNGTGKPGFDNAPCRPEYPETCPSPGSCEQDPTQTRDEYNVPVANAECLAFGASRWQRNDLANGLDLRRNAATGRANLWKSVDNAFRFLSGGGANCPDGPFGPHGAMHIIVLTDGPDTCTDGDDFSYLSLADPTNGKCRTKCAGADIAWHDLLIQMAKLKYPVHVHFVQFQAAGYKQPDPRMMEMACRTGGTYQFINSEDFNKSSSQEFADALARAVNRVRDSLAGTWRVGFRWPSDPDPLPVGQLRALDGDFVFTNPQFPSLDFAVHKLMPDAWRFAVTAPEDRRALLRRACTTDAQCGAADSCAVGHCGEGGLCAVEVAPDGRPCDAAGQAGRCHGGKCVDKATCP